MAFTNAAHSKQALTQPCGGFVTVMQLDGQTTLNMRQADTHMR